MATLSASPDFPQRSRDRHPCLWKQGWDGCTFPGSHPTGAGCPLGVGLLGRTVLPSSTTSCTTGHLPPGLCQGPPCLADHARQAGGPPGRSGWDTVSSPRSSEAMRQLGITEKPASEEMCSLTFNERRQVSRCSNTPASGATMSPGQARWVETCCPPQDTHTTFMSR
jgi:hypothetical protein